MLDQLWTALGQVAFDPTVLLVIVASAAYGVFMGAVPGLTATMAVALIVPITYFMPPLHAAAAVVALEACAIFAGDIPGALLRIPGTPSSAAYVGDMFAHTQKGNSDRALGVCLTASVAGGVVGTVLLFIFAGGLAQVATLFTSIEYFWFYLVGLGCAVVIAQGSPLRGLAGLCIGLLLSTVGLSAVHAEARFTLGRPELYQGINFIPAMIGLFGMSEILRHLYRWGQDSKTAPTAATDDGKKPGWVGSVFAFAVPELWRRKLAAARSALIGFFVGMLPGAGADIGGWVSFAVSKKRSKKPEEFGQGSLEGVADASTANSAALGGAWVPALSFGIPGDSITAILIGILMMKDIKLGPEIFEKQATLVYGLYFAFFLANLALIPIGFAAIKSGGLLVRIPRRILLPLVFLFCVLGAYAINGSRFDIAVMTAMGVLGFALERVKIPLAPVVLGVVLGRPLEESFIQSMTQTDGSIMGLVTRPLAAVLALAAVVLWLSPIWGRLRKRNTARI